MHEPGNTLTVTSTNAPTGTKTRHDLTVVESAPTSEGEHEVVVGIDAIKAGLYVVTVDGDENLCAITWAEGLEEALALFKHERDGSV